MRVVGGDGAETHVYVDEGCAVAGLPAGLEGYGATGCGPVGSVGAYAHAAACEGGGGVSDCFVGALGGCLYWEEGRLAKGRDRKRGGSGRGLELTWIHPLHAIWKASSRVVVNAHCAVLY